MLTSRKSWIYWKYLVVLADHRTDFSIGKILKSASDGQIFIISSGKRVKSSEYWLSIWEGECMCLSSMCVTSSTFREFSKVQLIWYQTLYYDITVTRFWDLFIPLWVTLALFQDHSGIKQLKLEMVYCSQFGHIWLSSKFVWLLNA